MQEHYNPQIAPYMELIDQENGKGYCANISKRGNFIKTQNGGASLFYEVKTIANSEDPTDMVRVVCINYLHYENKKELMSLLAFSCQWWKNLKPRLIYYREKDRKHSAGKYLKELGFKDTQLKNKLKEFDCLVDGGHPCTCKVTEYCGYKFN